MSNVECRMPNGRKAAKAAKRFQNQVGTYIVRDWTPVTAEQARDLGKTFKPLPYNARHRVAMEQITAASRLSVPAMRAQIQAAQGAPIGRKAAKATRERVTLISAIETTDEGHVVGLHTQQLTLAAASRRAGQSRAASRPAGPAAGAVHE